jgi:hypothetical protein
MPDMEILHKIYYIIRLILGALPSTPLLVVRTPPISGRNVEIETIEMELEVL